MTAIAGILFTLVVDLITYLSFIQPYLDKYKILALEKGRALEEVERVYHIMSLGAIAVVSMLVLLVYLVAKYFLFDRRE